MWRYGAMALVALTFSNENILFLEKYQHIHHDRINYIDPGPCHGLVIKQKKWKPKASFHFHLFFVTPTGLALPILSHHGLVIIQKSGNQKQAFVSTYFCL